MTTDPSPNPLPGGEPLPRPLAIQLLGVGGAGGNVVSYLARESLVGVTIAALNTDAPALARLAVPQKLILGSASTRGLGAGGDPEVGRKAAEENLAQIQALCQGAEVVFVLAGLGGGTGTGAGPVVARVAKEAGALTLGLVLLPFDCEGSRRQRQAQLGLHELRGVADGVICLPNQKVFKLIDEKTSLLEAFNITNELVRQGLRGIWRLLARPGLINVDFADLCAVTRGKHTDSTLATAEAQGDHRAREVLEKLLAHPLMEGGQVLSEAAGILVSIAGGPDLTMAEVNRIMDQIQRQGEQAHIIMGAAIEEELHTRLSVTLLAARRNGRPEPGTVRPESGGSLAADFETQLAAPPQAARPASRFIAPPPPTLPVGSAEVLPGGARGRKRPRLRQTHLPLEIVSKGRFEKSEPTIHHGQDLDVPTYLRRGVALN